MVEAGWLDGWSDSPWSWRTRLDLSGPTRPGCGFNRMKAPRELLPFDNEADPVALVQDALELWNAVGAGPLERDLVGDADDLHSPGVARYFAVGDGHHVIETQRLS